MQGEVQCGAYVSAVAWSRKPHGKRIDAEWDVSQAVRVKGVEWSKQFASSFDVLAGVDVRQLHRPTSTGATVHVFILASATA